MFSHEALFVNLCLLLGLVLFVWDRPADRVWARLTAVLMLTALSAWYAVWRCGSTLPEFGWSFASLWPWVFVTFEMAVLVYEAWALFVLVRLIPGDPARAIADYDAYLKRDPSKADVY